MTQTTNDRVADEAPRSGHAVERLAHRLDRTLDELAEAPAFARSRYQTEVFQVAEALLGSYDGLTALAERAPRFDGAGVFADGPWEHAGRLQAPLVSGGLAASGVYPVVETLSELRMLAIARGRIDHGEVSAADATAFLQETMALNLGYLFPAQTEQERREAGPFHESNVRLFQLLAEELGLASLRREVVDEIEKVCAQRPVMTRRVRRMIDMAGRIPDDDSDDCTPRLARFRRAVSGPTPLSAECPDAVDYRAALRALAVDALAVEAHGFADSVADTGLVAPQHAVLVRHLRSQHADLLPAALGLNDMGTAQMQEHVEFSHRLIRVAIHPSTAQSIYGLSRLLERGMLSDSATAGGLERLIDLDMQPDVRRALLAQRQGSDGVTANALLLAGMLSVLGQPLGIGQGHNPTCQSARGLSLWAQHAPSYLLQLTVSAARDGSVEMPFDGQPLRSDELAEGLAPRLDPDLDAVSLVLVPHLDRLYAEMMRRVALRPEDGHKWVNPALYGRWVSTGFATAFADLAQTTVSGFEDFVRRFYATHHPAYNDGMSLIYPNPVGLCVTNAHGDYLGPHAVSIQRVDEGDDGGLRVYFYNPNNEGRQDWGHGVQPTIEGHGEVRGESSLPFGDFAARLYAFHYNPNEEGDAWAVPKADIAAIEAAARGTWGKAFTWIDGGTA